MENIDSMDEKNIDKTNMTENNLRKLVSRSQKQLQAYYQVYMDFDNMKNELVLVKMENETLKSQIKMKIEEFEEMKREREKDFGRLQDSKAQGFKSKPKGKNIPGLKPIYDDKEIAANLFHELNASLSERHKRNSVQEQRYVGLAKEENSVLEEETKSSKLVMDVKNIARTYERAPSNALDDSKFQGSTQCDSRMSSISKRSYSCNYGKEPKHIIGSTNNHHPEDTEKKIDNEMEEVELRHINSKPVADDSTIGIPILNIRNIVKYPRRPHSSIDLDLQLRRHMPNQYNKLTESPTKSDGALKSRGGPSGLCYTKDTWYMNAIIQAIASSPVLTEQLHKLAKLIPTNDKLRIFIEVLTGINENKNDSNRVRSNAETLRKFKLTTQIKKHWASEENALDILFCCVDSIRSDILDVLVKNKMVMPPMFKLLQNFNKNSSYYKQQDNLSLALPLVGAFTEMPGAHINTMLNAFFEPSRVDDVSDTTTMYLYGKAPDILILHIQANEWNNDSGGYVKPKYYIKYEEILRYVFNIQRNINGSQPDKVREEYRLVAVVHHIGDISGGHCITYRKHGEEWYLINDEQVEKIHFKCDVVPYIMVYEKIVTNIIN